VTTLPGQTAAPEIRAPGPSPDPEALRLAYLGLLKLCLADLAGARRLTVSRTGSDLRPGQFLFTRELGDEELSVRVHGMDWPWAGLTMVGLARLDDLQSCVEQVVADRVEGDLIEAGVWRGGASILMRATLDSLGATDRTVWLADSFQGLPRPDEGFPEDRELDLSWIGFLAASVDEVRTHFVRFGCERGLNFVEGYFDESLQALRGQRWSLVRIDGDTYESTWIALDTLYPSLAKGGYLIVDDYQFLDECRAAVDDFREKHTIEEPVEMIDQLGARWRRDSDEPIQPSGGGTRKRRVRDRGLERSGALPTDAHLPSLQEVHLAAEVRELREHIAVLETQLERTLSKRIRTKWRRWKG
jgi:hypothetical protein